MEYCIRYLSRLPRQTSLLEDLLQGVGRDENVCIYTQVLRLSPRLAEVASGSSLQDVTSKNKGGVYADTVKTGLRVLDGLLASATLQWQARERVTRKKVSKLVSDQKLVRVGICPRDSDIPCHVA